MNTMKRWWMALALVATTCLAGCASTERRETSVGSKVAGGLAYGAVWVGLAMLDDEEEACCCCERRHARGHRCEGRSK